MKTLDEVINTLECYPVSPSTLPCSVSIVTVEDLHNALHYLKEYRKLDSLDAVAFPEDDNPAMTWDELKHQEIVCPKCHSEFVILPEANNALTWDELKQMKGKPVWMELGLLRPRWYLIEGFNGAQMVGVDALSVRVPFYKDAFYTGGCKAYRKERTDGEA